MFFEEGCPALVTAANPLDSLLTIGLRDPPEQPLAPGEQGCQRREEEHIPDADDDDGDGAQLPPPEYDDSLLRSDRV
jgi:hypothetical protein